MTTDELVRAALAEDLPQGDITTESLGIDERFGTAFLIAKQDLILSGQSLFEKACQLVDIKLACHWKFDDGDRVYAKQVIGHIQGNMINLLKAERVGLNFLCHLSGIATLTAKFVQACGEGPSKILDTRKTTPLLRKLEKKAVRDGGAYNHRANLSDAIMIKDNHLVVGEGIALAVAKIRGKTDKPITVEVKNFTETEEAVAAGVQRIMFDNMSVPEMARCLAIVPKEIETEATGNMTLERVADVAQLRVDYISVGALTHSAPVADISLEFNW